MRLVKVLAVSIGLWGMSFVSLAASKGQGEEKNTAAIAQVQPLLQDCGSLTARSLAYVCNRINSAQLTTDCFAAGNGRYLNQCALAACDRYTSAELTIECVRAIGDRDYTVEEVLACDRITDANETTRCLAAAGQYVGRRERVNVHEVRGYVYQTLDFLHNGQAQNAEQSLYDLLDYLRQRN